MSTTEPDEAFYEALAERRKREVAFHEAGHLVAAVKTNGCTISAAIEYRPGGRIGSHHWAGWCSSFWFDGEASAIIGLAGVAAEMLLDSQGCDWRDLDVMIGCEELEPSDSDWRHVGRAFGKEQFCIADWQSLADDPQALEQRDRLLQRTIELLQSNWAGVSAVAKHLMETHSCEGWDLIELGLFD